jgi:hypothetical protein
LDWIISLDKYFDYEEIDDEKKVKHAVTKLKGHVYLWWDRLQADIRRIGKTKIKSKTQGLLVKFVQEVAESETERFFSERVYRIIL